MPRIFRYSLCYLYSMKRMTEKQCIYTVSLPKSLIPLNIIKELAHNENIYEIRELIEEP